MTTSKTGKHGHAKCHFIATDIFTGKKIEELVPSSHNLEVLLTPHSIPLDENSMMNAHAQVENVWLA